MRRRSGYWRPAFVCAVAFHAILGLFAAFAGDLWGRLHPMPPVYTVRLFEVAEPLRTHGPKVHHPKEAAKEAAKARPRPKPKPKSHTKERAAHRTPKPKKKVVKAHPSRPKKAKTAAKGGKKAVAKRAAVSLHPTHKKARPKGRKVAKRGAQARQRRKRGLSKAHTGPSPDELLKRRLAALKKRVEMERAEERLARRLKELEAKRAREEAAASQGGAQGGQGRASQVLRLYLTRVYEAIRRHWILPESLLSNPDLEAVVVIRVMPDGSVARRWFERRSGLALFDDSVLRAVDQAAPLPPLPKALATGPLEIGVRFRPGDVGMS